MGIRVEARLRVGLKWEEEAGVYLSYTPALDLYSQAETEEGAMKAMESAITLYLRTAYDQDLLGRALKRHRFVPRPEPSPTADAEYIRILEERHFQPREEILAALDLVPA